MGHTQPFSVTDGTNNVKDVALKTAPTVSVESWSSMPLSKLTAPEEKETKELVFDDRIYGDGDGKSLKPTKSELTADLDVAEVAKTPDGAVLYSKWTGKPQEKASDRKADNGDNGAEPQEKPKADDGTKPEEKPQAVLVPTGADDKAKVGPAVIIPSNSEQVIERKTEVVGPGKVGALKPAGEEKPGEKVDAKPATGEDNKKADAKPATGEENKKTDAKPGPGDDKKADAKPDTTTDGANDKTKTDKKDALTPAQEKEVSEKMGQFKQDLINGNFVLNFKKGEGPFQALTRMRGEALAKQKAGKEMNPQEQAMAMLSEKDVLTVSRAIRDRDFKSMKDDHGKSRQWYSTKDQTPRYTKEDMEAAAKAREATLRQEAAKNVDKKEEPKAPEQPKKEEPKAPEQPKKEEPKAPEQPKKEEPKAPEQPKKEEPGERPRATEQPSKEEPKAPEQPKREEEPKKKEEEEPKKEQPRAAELPKKVAPAPEQPKKEQPKKAEATEEEEMETC